MASGSNWAGSHPTFRLFQPLREQARLPMKMDGMESKHFFCSQRPKPPNQPQLSKFHGHTWTGIPCIWSQISTHSTCEAMWSPETVARNFHDAVSHHCVRFVRWLQPYFFFPQVTMLKRHHSNISEDRLVKDGTWITRWVCPEIKHTNGFGVYHLFGLEESLTRRISQDVQIFVFLFVKKMTASAVTRPGVLEHSGASTSPVVRGANLTLIFGDFGDCDDEWKTATKHSHPTNMQFWSICRYIFKWFAHPIFDSLGTNMPVGWELQPHIIGPIWLVPFWCLIQLVYYLLTFEDRIKPSGCAVTSQF